MGETYDVPSHAESISPIAPDGRCCATCRHLRTLQGGEPVCNLAKTQGLGADKCQGPDRDLFQYWEPTP